MDELARAIRAREASVSSGGVDATGKLRLTVTLPGSDTVRRQSSR